MNPFPWLAIFFTSVSLHAQDLNSTQGSQGERQFDKPNAITMEMSWNGLSGGLGGLYSYYVPNKPSVMDIGFGLGFTGTRFGARYRHLLVHHKRTSPFVGVGLNYATGNKISDLKVTDSNDDTLKISANPSANLLFNVGLDLKANNGFVFIPSIGWAIDLMDNDYTVVSGVENRSNRQALRLMLKGGFQLSFIAGWSF